MYPTITTIHLHCQIGERKEWCIACNPNETNLGSTNQQVKYMLSGDPRAVNCVVCQRTEIYKRMKEKLGVS